MTKFASLKSVRLAGAAAIALLAGAAQAQNSPPNKAQHSTGPHRGSLF